MASVSIKNLKKSFGAVEVLRDLSLDIQEGEFLAIVGPSGCGKSTLLRILAGLDEPTEGDIIMNGQIVNDLSPKERNIAMVFQSYALYPHMTVAQNMGFNLRISGLSKSEMGQRIQETAKMLDIESLLDRKPSQLSGGQRQRVAMGRALVRKPDAFLFDEPLSNLDAKLRVQMREEIKRLHLKIQTTSIYVTHDQIEAMTLANRIVIMNDGQIQQIGTPTELYQKPANVFVASFIGSPAMNLVAAELGTDGDRRTLTLQNGEILFADLPNLRLPNGPVIAGFRPENLRLTQSGPNVLNGIVDILEPAGAQNHLKISVGEMRLTVVDSDLVPVELNDHVGVAIAPEKIHVFHT